VNDDERKLLIDLVTSALMVLETSHNTAKNLLALKRLLKTKRVVSAEEIAAVEQNYDMVTALSDDPEISAFADQWRALLQRLTEARQRLEES